MRETIFLNGFTNIWFHFLFLRSVQIGIRARYLLFTVENMAPKNIPMCSNHNRKDEYNQYDINGADKISFPEFSYL